MQKKNNLLGLDVGSVRIGVAVVADGVAVPRSLPALANDDKFVANLKAMIEEKKIDEIVAGLPRNLNGDDTPQTAYVRNFVEKLSKQLGLPIRLQDEALTSNIAEGILGVDSREYQKGEIDSLAACRILLDYLDEA